MKKRGKARSWWWVIVALLLLGVVAYFAYYKKGVEPKRISLPPKKAPVKSVPSPAPPPEPREKPVPVKAFPQEEKALTATRLQEDPCASIQEELSVFFQYLGKKKYVRDLYPQTKIHVVFTRIAKKLIARPPVPAGERTNPQVIIANLYHFFRLLDRKELRLIKTLTQQEQDSLEVNLDMFYRYLTLTERCPEYYIPRPPLEVLYKYAGFFLNSTGGRAYVFRRSAPLRLLISYYALLIIQQADKQGKNTYGIDIYPVLLSTTDEIAHYPDFIYQQDYLGNLSQIRQYYAKKRSVNKEQ